MAKSLSCHFNFALRCSEKWQSKWKLQYIRIKKICKRSLDMNPIETTLRILPLRFLILSFLFLNTESNHSETRNDYLPKFSMESQNGIKITEQVLKNKNGLLLGCYPDDWELCKKIGRKIYWKMQNYIYGREKEFEFVGYLNFENPTALQLQYFYKIKNNKNIETIYLDKKGFLKIGLKLKSALLRTYDTNGKLILYENIGSIDDKKVESIFKSFKLNSNKEPNFFGSKEN